jgi:hypothetical protein
MVQAEKIIEQVSEQREQRQQLLRPVAEFFHEHEGELFERYEAVEKLIEAEDIPSDDERILHQVVGNLASDRVDPVQNVVADDGKYVGVLDYDEHDYWYEYVEVDDVKGRMNVGVCAQCVSEATSDANVAKGIGTTEELAKKIKDHYAKKHTESPEEVKTGATLVSGTTIAGNDAITTSTDAVAAGLNADTVQGNEASEFVNENVAYSKTEQSGGQILSKFASPSDQPRGVGLDSNESVWLANNGGANPSCIYQLNQSGTVLTQFTSPNTDPEGVGVDSNGCIWNADYSSDTIYQLNQSGSVLSQFGSPSSSPAGVGVDSNDSLWHAAPGLDSIYKFDKNGSTLSKFASPCSDPSGLGVDSNDSIWNADGTADSIYQLNQSGSVLSSFPTPSGFPKGVGLDSSDSIWHAGVFAESIYQMTTYDKITYE